MWINKFKIFLQSRKIIKNWYALPLIYYKFGKKKYVILKTKNGLKIKLRKQSTDFMQFATIWLIKEYSMPKFSINDNDIIIDIGSHIGLFALFASQYCKKGRIFCFEPIKENFDLLVENLKINEISNVVAVNKAVSKIDGNVTMFLNEDSSGHNLIVNNNNKTQVPSISLKTFFEKNVQSNFNLVKMDCEGSEYNIIESLPSSYFDKIEKMIIEYHFLNSNSELFQKMITKLKKCSFKIETIENTDDMGMIYAIK